MLEQEKRNKMYRPIQLYNRDIAGQIYEEEFTFREENPSWKRKEDILEKRTVCKESECKKYKLLADKFLDIY